jgi:hypothetical protein
MESDRRVKLEEKRRHLQLRQRRAEEARTFRRVAPALCARGIRFARATPLQGRRALGTLASGPGRDERLIWDGIPGAVCTKWRSAEEGDRLLADALDACTAPDSRVTMIWHPREAGLRMRAADLAACAQLAIDSIGGAAWIVDAAGGPWLIEISLSDGEICYSRTMPGQGGKPAQTIR